jgi:PAS domain S-box-containing protein
MSGADPGAPGKAARLNELVERLAQAEAALQAEAAGQVDTILMGDGRAYLLQAAQAELSRTNRALQMLSSCNDALIRHGEEDMLLREICRITVEIGGYDMAWVGFAENDEARTIRPVARAGTGTDFLDRAEFSWSEDRAVGRGPAGRTVRSGRPTVIDDAATDEGMRAWQPALAANAVRSLVGLPLREQDRTFGVLVLHLRRLHPPGADEIRLLQELADNLAFGLTSARARAEREKVEAKLREQAALLDHARDAILVHDLDLRITFWNKGAERLYGWSVAEAMGQSADWLLYRDPTAFRQVLEQVVSRGEWTGELVQQGKDGREIVVAGRKALVRDEQGRPRSILAINTDLTERKEIEARFLRAQRVESVGALAGGIAHDLNNLLTPILMSVGLLKASVRGDSEQRVLQTLESGALRAAELVRQVLTFTRGSHDQPVPARPEALIAEVAGVIRETFPKSITVRTHLPEAAWSILCDPTQLHQALLNLCVNARDAMPAGGTLTIEAENLEPGQAGAAAPVAAAEVAAAPRPAGRRVALRVGDTGTGIPPEIQGRLFEPFFTTKEPGRGTGLGLATVATIVKSHGGTIGFTSVPGRGTTFTLLFPAAETTSSDEPPEAVSAAPGRGEWVLVVDDEASVRLITEQTLEMHGYRVLSAAHGVEAAAIFAERRAEIAAVITDMMMPVMDGAALIRELTRLDPGVRIIAASGLEFNGSVIRPAGPGVRRFLPKPYSVQTLLSTLEEVLRT